MKSTHGNNRAIRRTLTPSTVAPAIIPLLLSACVVPPRDRPAPEIAMPSQWSVSQPAEETPANQPWWERFEDAELTRIVRNAIEANANLAVLAQRVELARAEGGLNTAAAQPGAGTSAGLRAGKERSRETGFQTASLMPWTASGGASWELDWLGKWRDRRSAARENVRAFQSDLDAGILLLTADIARNWFELRRSQSEISILESQLKHQSEILSIYRDQLQAGLVESADVERQEAEAAELNRRQVESKMRLEIAVRRLDRLQGFAAGSTTGYPRIPFSSGTLTPQLPPALPTDVLRQRPDLAAAEARLRSAFALERASRLDLFPSLNLRLGGTTMTGSLSDPFRSWIAAVGPTLELPIWDPERIARSRALGARAKVAAAEYRAAALLAIEEVEVALVRFARDREQLALAAVIERKAESVRDQTVDKLRAGLVSQLALLEDERRFLASKLTRLEIHARLLTDTVAVFLAMGGS